MRFKIAIIFILLSLFIIPKTTNAAVPVVVFGEYLEDLYNIHENTDMELSLEKFMINLFNAFATRQEEFQKTFELAKIEKAREDVNKLNFEVQRELTGQGVIIEAKDPVTNKKYTIKKEGRMITNPDDFLFEEPLQKARDFTYCYLAPWKHFTLDPNDKQYCDDLGLEGAECTTSKICKSMPQKTPNGITQCPSDVIRDQIKQQLLSDLVRKEPSWAKAPPESWYTPAICERVTNSLSCADKETCFKCDDFISQSCDVKTEDELTNAEIKGIHDSHSSLAINIASSENATLQEYQETMGNPNNDAISLKRMLKQQIQGIIDQYQTLRQTQYAAGQGIRPEKYLVAFTDKTDDCKRYFNKTGDEDSDSSDCKTLDEKFFGRQLTINYNGANNAYTDQLFWFDTENITSPAVILLQKMAAAAQAQFDLAQKAYKYPADNSELVATTTSNGAGTVFSDEEGKDGAEGVEGKYEIPIQTPSIPTYTINDDGTIEINKEETVDYLYTPWEDPFDYAKLPDNYSVDDKGEIPPELGENYYLNRWYKDINQMYLPQDEKTSTFSRILVEWFCIEDESGLDNNCYEARNPKYTKPLKYTE